MVISISQERSDDRYIWIKDIFSFSKDEMQRLKSESSKRYVQNELIDPDLRVNVDHLEILNLSLKSLLGVNAFLEKKEYFRHRILEEFEECLTEIVIGGLLAQSGLPLFSFAYKYCYDDSEVKKDFDICAVVQNTEILLEIATRRKRGVSDIPGMKGLKRMHLKNLQSKYVDKKIEQAYRFNSIRELPIIFIVNNLWSVQQLSLNGAKPFLEKCELLHSIIMFSGYRIVSNNVKLSQANIYYNYYCMKSIKDMIDNRALTALVVDNWSVDALYDLKLLQKRLLVNNK